jgi:hypothetical protein
MMTMTRRFFPMIATVAALVLLASTARSSHAAPPCGVRGDEARPPNAGDALFVLQAAVGVPGLCGPCTCDVDRSGVVSAVDAAAVLSAAVGLDVALDCPFCPCLASARIFAGTSPRSIAVVDTNDDGRLDIVTANTESDDVVVRYATGRGRFDDFASFWVGETPLSALIADLDGDGTEDVATANALPGDITVLRGNADGSFGSFGWESRIEAGLAPINSAAVDVDGDSVLDLVVANSLSHDVSVLLGNGDATFRTYARLPVGLGPRWVSVADLDGDGVTDAVTANRDDDDLSILRGQGDGTFVETERIDVAAGPYHVVIDDMNADAVADLVVANFYGSGISVLLGHGDATFEGPAFSATAAGAIASTTADLDRDGLLDVAVANLPSEVTVLLGVGDGRLGPAATVRAQGGPRALVAHDADEDGNLDLLVAGSRSHDVIFLHGLGDGTFASERTSPAWRFANAMATGDLDGDGRLDIWLAGARYWLSTFLGDGAGGFTGAARVQTLRSPQQLFPAAVDADPSPDVIVRSAPYCWDECYDVEPYRPYVSYFLGAPGGMLGTEVTLGDLEAWVIAVADLDGDGLSDIVAEDVGIAGLTVLRNDSDGSFVAAGRVDAGEVAALLLADVNDDDHADLLFVESTSQQLGIAAGDGAGGFSASVRYAVGEGPNAVLAGDINADGLVDVVVTNAASDDVSVLLALPGGSLGAEVRSPAGGSLTSPRLVDLDGDRALDLVGVKWGVAYAMRGDGRGRLAAPMPIADNVPGIDARGPVAVVSVGDFDDAALPDAVAVNSTKRDPTFVTVSRVGACLLP